MVMGITIPDLLPKQRIVIIDDEPVFAKSLAIMLGSLGYEVLISTDASNALDLQEEDIVFLDVLMPNTSGLQVLEQLSLQERTCAIILMSGNAESLEGAEKYARSLNLNLVGVLDKPFGRDDLKGVLPALPRDGSP
jgi:CheY-like chemotaxis protein